MPFEQIESDFPVVQPPGYIADFLAAASLKIDQFFDAKRDRRLPRYVPSDPETVYSALEYVRQKDLALGNVFCEWGCGFGVCASMATLLGYESYGIEIEPELARHSRELVEEHRLNTQILNTSFLPEGFESYLAHGGYRLMTPPGFARSKNSLNHSLRYEDMELEIEEIDLFYCYPWPEEQELMLELFEAVAAEDALLLAFYGQGDINLYRKTL